MNLETFLRQAYDQKAKVRFRNVPEGISLEFSVRGKGTHTIHLRGNKLVTLATLQKKARKARPKKSASAQKIEAGVKEAVA